MAGWLGIFTAYLSLTLFFGLGTSNSLGAPFPSIWLPAIIGAALVGVTILLARRDVTGSGNVANKLGVIGIPVLLLVIGMFVTQNGLDLGPPLRLEGWASAAS